jgi:hypothetical protein
VRAGGRLTCDASRSAASAVGRRADMPRRPAAGGWLSWLSAAPLLPAGGSQQCVPLTAAPSTRPFVVRNGSARGQPQVGTPLERLAGRHSV